MIYITGDTHGELERFKGKELRRLGKNDILLVLGDFGFLWDGSKEEKKKLDWLAKRPYTILFLDGTHENYDLLDAYPIQERFGGKVQPIAGNVYHVCRGSILELEGQSYLCFGGGESTDKEEREPGVNWWARGNALGGGIRLLPGQCGGPQLQSRVCADPRRPKQVFGFHHPARRGKQPAARLF